MGKNTRTTNDANTKQVVQRTAIVEKELNVLPREAKLINKAVSKATGKKEAEKDARMGEIKHVTNHQYEELFKAQGGNFDPSMINSSYSNRYSILVGLEKNGDLNGVLVYERFVCDDEQSKTVYNIVALEASRILCPMCALGTKKYLFNYLKARSDILLVRFTSEKEEVFLKEVLRMKHRKFVFPVLIGEGKQEVHYLAWDKENESSSSWTF